MCGRARCTLRPDHVPNATHRQNVPARFLHTDRYRPSYNVAPGSYIPVLRRDNEAVGGVVVHCMKWGLVPSFTKNTDKPDFFKMFNARSESVSEKPSFRRLLPKNRCLVAVDGFYEWKKDGAKKQPYYIHFKDGRPLVFAALFDSWQNSGGETLYTFTILTTSSSSALHWLHDRMPVILGDKDSVNTWLDDPSTSKLKPLLAPYESSDLVWYPVTPAIGKLSFDGPECIQQIPLKENSLISKFFSTKEPKTDEGDKETKSIDAYIPVHLKEEPTDEGEGAVFSNSTTKFEEPYEEKDISNESKNIGSQKNVKAEPVIEDNSSVESHFENEVEDGSTKGEGISLKTSLTKETRDGNCSIPTESDNLDLPGISKEEPKTQGQLELLHETNRGEPRNENEMKGLTGQTTKEGGLESSEKSSGKSRTKQGHELFSAEERPLKRSEMSVDVKSTGKQGRKQGKGKSNMKKSKETQSTLHFFFDEK